MRQPTANAPFRQEPSSIKTELTRHAWQRMTARSIPCEAVNAALQYGRLVYTRGAAICVIGRKEVEQCRKHGVNLIAYEGVQVVCAPDGTVLTTYRNRNFRGLRAPGRKRSRR
ncbi:MAG: DUF4258 domain-containing protein [Desulfovibrionales bacterium]|nr:MAG: DUF4258 domain-containing protein [Desulfovibrionales bacterium]